MFPPPLVWHEWNIALDLVERVIANGTCHFISAEDADLVDVANSGDPRSFIVQSGPDLGNSSLIEAH